MPGGRRPPAERTGTRLCLLAAGAVWTLDAWQEGRVVAYGTEEGHVVIYRHSDATYGGRRPSDVNFVTCAGGAAAGPCTPACVADRQTCARSSRWIALRLWIYLSVL
jgi:hypothetical protein